MANLIPLSKSSLIKSQKSAIIKSDKFLVPRIKSSSAIVKFSGKTSQTLEGGGVLNDILKKVIQIDKVLKDSLFLSKKENEKKRVVEEKKNFDKRENELEKNKPKPISSIKLPSPPKMGFLDWIKNFITQTILGFFAVRLIDFLPQLSKILPVVIKIGDFFIDVGGKMLDSLVTFVDWGYKAIDGTRQFVKQLGGEGLAKNFDKFADVIDNVIELAIISALATADSGGGGDLADLSGDFFKRRVSQQAATTVGQQASGAAGRTAGVGVGAAAGIVAGVGLLSSALGEGAFQIRKFAIKPIQNLENEYKKDKNPLTKIGRGVVLNMVRPLYGVFSTVGFLLDVVGAPFRYAIELLRYPFLSDEDKVKQARNLAKFDARIREDLRKALNMLTLGFAFKEKGSFGNIYGNKGAQTEMMSKMAGGGKPATRGGKPVSGPAKRTIKKKKTPRTLRSTPSKLKPGSSVGGEKKIKELYPETKDKTKRNPFNFLKNAYEGFAKSKGLGALTALTIKPLMGDKPSYADYKNAAVEINNWMNQSVGSGTLAYAGGGEVRMESIISGEDYSDVIAKSLQNSIAPQVDKTIQDLMKQMMLKKEGDGTPTKPASDEDVPEGTGSLTGNTNAEKVFNYLIGYGFTEQAAAGVIGNLMQESSVNPQSRQLGGGPGRGIMQWGTGAGSGGRWDALVAWAESSGKDPWKLDTQVEWMMKEMRSYGTLNRLKGVTNVKKAVEIFESEMEKAGTPNYPRRYQFAADALASFGKGRAGGAGVPLGSMPGNLASAKQLALGMGLQLTSAQRGPRYPGDRSLHISGRAMDFSNGVDTPQQKAFAKEIIKRYGSSLAELIYTPLGYGIANGKKVGLDYWGEETNANHYDHVHVAFEKGGKVGGFTKAILGEKGPEFVIDADSTRALEDNFPGFLDALNKAKYNQAIQVLMNYASYNQPAQVIKITKQVPVPLPIPMGGGGSSLIVRGGSDNYVNSNMEHTLAQIA